MSSEYHKHSLEEALAMWSEREVLKDSLPPAEQIAYHALAHAGAIWRCADDPADVINPLELGKEELREMVMLGCGFASRLIIAEHARQVLDGEFDPEEGFLSEMLDLVSLRDEQECVIIFALAVRENLGLEDDRELLSAIADARVCSIEFDQETVLTHPQLKEQLSIPWNQERDRITSILDKARSWWLYPEAITHHITSPVSIASLIEERLSRRVIVLPAPVSAAKTPALAVAAAGPPGQIMEIRHDGFILEVVRASSGVLKAHLVTPAGPLAEEKCALTWRAGGVDHLAVLEIISTGEDGMLFQGEPDETVRQAESIRIVQPPPSSE